MKGGRGGQIDPPLPPEKLPSKSPALLRLNYQRNILFNISQENYELKSMLFVNLDFNK